MLRAVRLASAVIALALLVPSAHAADPCEAVGKASPGSCLPAELDGQGCCPKRPPCPAGKVRTPKTRFRCCWPGQELKAGRCALRPSVCPTGLFATSDDCVVPVACDGGKTVAPDGRHCCWPGQRWEGDACRGAPQCSAGQVASGAECVVPPPCQGGRTRMSDGLHCCWVGQTWGGAGCVGTPQCLDGFRPEGADCVLRPCGPGRVRVADGIHCCFPGQSFADGVCAGACPDGFQTRAGDCVLSPCETGRVRVDALHCCWPGQTWDGACAGTPACPTGMLSDRASACVIGVALTVSVERPPPGFVVHLDGQALELTGSLATRLVAPGRHEVYLTAPGHEDVALAFEVAPGNPVVLPFKLTPVTPPRTSLVPWIVTSGGMALVGGVTGALLMAEAGTRRDEIRGAAEDGVVSAERLTQREAQALEDDADTLATWGAVSFTVGGLALAAGATLLVLELNADGAPGQAVRIVPRPDGGFVWWSGTW